MALSNPRSPAPLSGAQRRWLRGQAHALRPVIQVGGGGLSQAVLGAVDQALLAHELIKVRLIQPEDKKAAARELAERSGAELCGLVGHTVILYRPHPEEPKLELPR
ncbi:MAG: ribosome assembly RNA-binding protein YhbY [bacterium]|nr:ribosome assembly RNA-binding protein YhbY [bacterium]MCP5070288.1 ribosome assembly RNA-binding protein YhbY [bacterium]